MSMVLTTLYSPDTARLGHVRSRLTVMVLSK